MRPLDAAKPMFARHETFHPRYGWFRKAYSFAAEDPRIFSREDAPVRIGVGKNMVRAIRFWGLAAKLIEVNERSSNRRASDLTPTCLGHALFGESGWGPDTWRIQGHCGSYTGCCWPLPRCCRCGGSRLNEFPAVEFHDDDLVGAVTAQLETRRWMECATSVIGEEGCRCHAAHLCAGGADRAQRYRRNLGLPAPRA